MTKKSWWLFLIAALLALVLLAKQFGCVPVTYPVAGDNRGNSSVPGNFHVGGNLLVDGDIVSNGSVSAAETVSANGNVIADADSDGEGDFIDSPATDDDDDGHPLPPSLENPILSLLLEKGEYRTGDKVTGTVWLRGAAIGRWRIGCVFSSFAPFDIVEVGEDSVAKFDLEFVMPTDSVQAEQKRVECRAFPLQRGSDTTDAVQCPEKCPFAVAYFQFVAGG